MSAAVRAGIKQVAKMTAVSALLSAVAVMSGPVVTVLVAAVYAMLFVLCWVLSDETRTGRLVELIQAMRSAPPPPQDGRSSE